MHDRPSAAELVEAVREFLEREVVGELEGRKRFHARVAVNALGIVERELRAGEQPLRAEWRRLAPLVERDPEPPPGAGLGEALEALERDVALAIRAGNLDDRWDEAVRAVRQSDLEKLRVANPGYAGGGVDGSSAGS